MREFDGIEREVGGPVDLSVIWLHGLGADCRDFLPIVNQLELSTGVRFVFPNAPVRPVTINGGMAMRAWYDIKGFGPDAPLDVVGLTESVAIVGRLVEREIQRDMPSERIVLAGFSQGGAVVLHTGLTFAERLGGIIGLSTYLPAGQQLLAANLRTDVPVMLAHGTSDPILPLSLGQASADFLLRNGVAVDWTTYPMQHEVCFDEIRELSRWLARFGPDRANSN